MRIAGLALCLALAVGAGGCASIHEAYDADPDDRIPADASLRFDSPSIEEAFQRSATLPVPAHLAVNGRVTSRYGHFMDRSAAEFESALRGDPARWSAVDPLPAFLSSGDGSSVDGLRKGAARMHCDALLVYEQREEIERGQSPLLILNLLILPAFCVPTMPYEVTLETQAALVDVRNGFVYLTLRDFRKAEGLSPSAYTHSSARETKAALRVEAFNALRDELGRRLSSAASAPGGGR